MLLYLCCNLLGLTGAVMLQGTLRTAFLETKSSLSVSLLLEESSREQVLLPLNVVKQNLEA